MLKRKTLYFKEKITAVKSNNWSKLKEFYYHHLCKIPIGKAGVGSVVNQRRKSGCGLLIFSKCFSNTLTKLNNR